MLAQRYVSDPLLINGCKFGVRLWLLVTGTDPLMVYLHNQGLVLFSTDRCVCVLGVLVFVLALGCAQCECGMCCIAHSVRTSVATHALSEEHVRPHAPRHAAMTCRP